MENEAKFYIINFPVYTTNNPHDFPFFFFFLFFDTGSVVKSVTWPAMGVPPLGVAAVDGIASVIGVSIISIPSVMTHLSIRNKIPGIVPTTTGSGIFACCLPSLFRPAIIRPTIAIFEVRNFMIAPETGSYVLTVSLPLPDSAAW